MAVRVPLDDTRSKSSASTRSFHYRTPNVEDSPRRAGGVQKVVQSFLQNRVVKRGNAPDALILHEYPDAQFLVRWQRLPLCTDQPTQLIGDVRERDVRPDESYRHVQRLQRDVVAPGLEDRG